MKHVLAVLWLALVALAQPVAAKGPAFPTLTGRVVDDAHLLTPSQVVDLSTKSDALEAQSGRQLVVATIPSLQGLTIEDYGYQLGRAWGIGQKGKNDGVILLVAPNERKVRIENGYGATIFLTDAMSSVIIRNSILPEFRKSPPDYGAGITAGADQIIKQMSLPPDEAARQAAAASKAERQREDSSPGFIPVIFWMIVILFVISSMFRRVRGRAYRRRGGGIDPMIVLWGLDALSRSSRGRGGWGGGGGFGGWGGGGGGFGGGGFSGGGGSFGGGGASGSW
ncbi:MAG TPA: TPM domain-containing protein [Sphingomicrobium sp.]|nr:TPM domain-containing protein [Sphingomicrobium sp.]